VQVFGDVFARNQRSAARLESGRARNFLENKNGPKREFDAY